jgi:hypothetical protein
VNKLHSASITNEAQDQLFSFAATTRDIGTILRHKATLCFEQDTFASRTGWPARGLTVALHRSHHDQLEMATTLSSAPSST